MGERIAALVEAQRPALALWVPVLLGLGIALYFALPSEPGNALVALLGMGVLAGGALLFRSGPLAVTSATS